MKRRMHKQAYVCKGETDRVKAANDCASAALKAASGKWVVWERGREVARGDERCQGAVVKPDHSAAKAGCGETQ